MKFRFCIVLFLCWIVSSCATWYQRTAAFQDAVSKGEFEQAEKLLQKDKKPVSYTHLTLPTKA